MIAQPATTVSRLLGAPFNSWSPEKLLDHFRQRQSVRYFPIVDETQIIRAKTDQVLDNCFDFNEEVYQLAAGFDWTANPSADVEWLILLHKFYYATGLGIAYDETNDERYAQKWIKLTDSWINAVQLDFLPTDVMGRRIQNWLSAHFYFVTKNRAASLSPDFYLRFLHSLHGQVTHLKANLTPARNHRTLELWALFFTAVVFPEFKISAEWLGFAKEQLSLNAQSDFLPDGVHSELSSDYHHLALRNFLYAIELARMNQIELPDELHSQVRRALEFALYIHKPDGKIPALSDGDTASYLSLLRQGHELYGDETMLYAATQGRQGRAPAFRSRGFASGGYYILRSGWGETEPFADERYLIFDCGPLGAGNHGHFDLLSFEAAAFGQSLVVDPSRYTYHEPASADSTETNWRVMFRSTAAHNTVVVDCKNQTRYEFHKRKFKIKGDAPAHELKSFITRKDFDYLHGVARSNEYAAVHERRIAFIASEYWVISDLLLSDEEHDYDLLFHLSDKAFGKISVESRNGTLLVDSPNLVIAQSHDANITASIGDGYVSPSYGIKHPAPVVRSTQRGQSASFHTVLFPYKTECPEIA
ncbi:MAG: alginate lyase family protein, partial [Acidobacteriota bacterium]